MCITHVVSFSGGRTSAYLVHLMEEQRKAGNNVCYIFMDTWLRTSADIPLYSGGCEVLGHIANCVAGRYKSRAWAAKWLYGMGTKGYSDTNAGA